MSLFDYESVMISIVLGVGVTQIFAGIGATLQPERKLRIYWMHSAWAIILVWFHVHMWWSFWDYRDIATWDYARFLYVLFGPAGLVVASNVLVPQGVPVTGPDLEAHYYSSARLFFNIFGVVILWAIFLGPLLGVQPLFTAYRAVQVLGLALVAACARWSYRGLHAVTALSFAAFMVGAIVMRLHPGAFAP